MDWDLVLGRPRYRQLSAGRWMPDGQGEMDQLDPCEDSPAPGGS